MKKMKDRKMNPMRRTLVGVLTVVMLFGICFSGVQIPAFADELYQNTIEQEFDQAVTLLCMQYRTFAGSEADRELLDMELESLQIQIEKAENISDAARKDLMERLSEYAPEKKEDTPKTSFYGSGPLRTTGSTSVETKSLSFTKTVDKKSADNDL